MASPRVFEVTIPSTIPIEAGFADVRSHGARYGVRVAGTSSAGEFTGVAQGRYLRKARQLTVWVERKPIFVTWGMIEAGLRRLEAGKIRRPTTPR